MFIKPYNEEKEGLAAEVEEFDFLITTNDLIVMVVIMFIKFFQYSKCCSIRTIVFLIFIVIFLLIHSFLITYLDILNTTNYLLIEALC